MGHAKSGVMCVKGHHMGGVMYGVTHLIIGATHSGKGSICSKLFVRQGFSGWPGLYFSALGNKKGTNLNFFVPRCPA